MRLSVVIIVCSMIFSLSAVAEYKPLEISKILFEIKNGEPALSVSGFPGAVLIAPADGPGILIEEINGKSLKPLRINQSGPQVYLKPWVQKIQEKKKPRKEPAGDVEEEAVPAEPEASTAVPSPVPEVIAPEAMQLQIFLPMGATLKLDAVNMINVRMALGDLRIDTESCANIAVHEAESVRIKASGRCAVLIGKTKSATLDISGSSQIQINELSGGKLDINASESASVTARGSFLETDLKTRGSARIVTSGPVTEKYRALALNSSLIGHNGPVYGKIVRKLSDTAQVNLSPIVK